MQGGGRDREVRRQGVMRDRFRGVGLSFAVSAGRAQHRKAEQKVELFNGSLPNEDQLRVGENADSAGRGLFEFSPVSEIFLCACPKPSPSSPTFTGAGMKKKKAPFSFSDVSK